MASKNIKHLIGEIAVCVSALAILLTIMIPTISTCFENGSEKKYRANLSIITAALNEAINSHTDTEKWIELLNQKKSQQILNTLKQTMSPEDAAKIDVSEYYIKNEDGELKVMCRRHTTIEDYSVKLPNGFISASSTPQEGKLIDHLQVTGVRTYLQNESINPANPEQMQFTSEDDLKSVFTDITVSIIYAGGAKQTLSPDEYTISTNGFDMSSPGTKRIKISYKANTRWNDTIYKDFTFEVLQKAECPPLEIDFGDKGIYVLAAWDWTDYVEEASQSEGGAKNFDASIVYYDGAYYYYPDGFNIDSRRNNSEPDTSAADIDDNLLAAYRIEFNKDIIISSKENGEEMKKVEEGALMLEEEQVYIWQNEPSKELDSGWIRVFCELKKK